MLSATASPGSTMRAGTATPVAGTSLGSTPSGPSASGKPRARRRAATRISSNDRSESGRHEDDFDALVALAGLFVARWEQRQAVSRILCLDPADAVFTKR